MLLRLKRELTPGSSYFVKLVMKGRVAIVEARVIRVEPRHEDYLAGMEFVVVSPEDAELLQNFLGAGKERRV